MSDVAPVNERVSRVLLLAGFRMDTATHQLYLDLTIPGGRSDSFPRADVDATLHVLRFVLKNLLDLE